MNLVLNVVLSGFAVMVSAYLIPGVNVEGFFAAIVVALVLAIANAIVRPLIELLTLPLNILTLGLFSLVITALMVMLTDYFVTGFSVDGFLTALIFGVVLSLINGVLFSFTKKK
jgi:putative membrane protein